MSTFLRSNLDEIILNLKIFIGPVQEVDDFSRPLAAKILNFLFHMSEKLKKILFNECRRSMSCTVFIAARQTNSVILWIEATFIIVDEKIFQFEQFDPLFLVN